MHSVPYLAFALSALAGRAAADCLSYGYDFVDGGGPYCINSTSTAYFTFGTEFFGCSASDVQGSVTPILVDPNENEYFCSDIGVTPDGQDMVSTCNVPGNVVTKNNMISGGWTAVIEGLTFAYMRQFSIIAAPPVTVVSTPTATFTVTSTPSATVTTTLTSVFSATANASTITMPSSTLTRTVTTKPAQVTFWTTSTITRTRTTRTFSKTISTTTVTTSCKTQTPTRDPTCTFRPSKATLAAATLSTSKPSSTSSTSNTSATVAPRMRQWEGRPQIGGFGSGHWAAKERRDVSAPVDTGPDMCTTTVVDTADAVSSFVTVTASTSTETDTTDATTTTTITPAAVTAWSGKAKTTVTITAATPTRMRTTRTYVTVWSTSTVWATIASTVNTPPPGWICATTAAH